MKINLLTVCTNVYPVEYARKLITKVVNTSKLDIIPYCITDRPEEVWRFATPIVQTNKHILGWWNKILTYGPDMPEGWNLYMDLDIVVQQNFDEEIMWAVKNDPKGESITCVSDAINWMNNRFSSSWMMHKPGMQTHIYDLFMDKYHTIQEFPGGDQVWVGLEVKPKIIYIDEKFPNLKKNLKFDLGEKVFGEWSFPFQIPNNIKLVDCGGQPKPHDLELLPYIKQNWHDV